MSVGEVGYLIAGGMPPVRSVTSLDGDGARSRWAAKGQPMVFLELYPLDGTTRAAARPWIINGVRWNTRELRANGLRAGLRERGRD